jgi:hypothetical protein
MVIVTCPKLRTGRSRNLQHSKLVVLHSKLAMVNRKNSRKVRNLSAAHSNQTEILRDGIYILWARYSWSGDVQTGSHPFPRVGD